MFSYIRYFVFISLLLVVVAAYFIGVYFRSMATHDLQAIVERSNTALVQGFINSIWKERQRYVIPLLKQPENNWKRSTELINFKKDSFRFFEEISVARLNFYTTDGVSVFSFDQALKEPKDDSQDVIADIPDDPRSVLFKTIMKPEIHAASRIEEDTTIRRPDGHEITATVVQTFVPIVSDDYVPVLANNDSKKVEAVIEVWYDITALWSQLYQFQIIASLGIITIFVILLAALYLTSIRAESIIAKQHEKNVELAATAARAEAENQEKSQFLANISHELRTPLNSIIGFSEIIKKEVMGPINNDTYLSYVTDIYTSGSHLLSLINDILDYSKAEAGKLELDIAEIDASRIMASCMRLIAPRAEEAGVNLVSDLPKQHFVITTDGKKFKQILLNLLSNAVKFTPPDKSVQLTAWQNVTDEALVIEVKDTGIGIAPKDISKALSPFGQVDSELSRKYEGTGLGLPLTKKFVEVMGGTFVLESEVDLGTTITITLPKEPPAKWRKKLAKPIEPGSMEEEPSPTA